MELKSVKPTFEPGDYILFVPDSKSGIIVDFSVVEIGGYLKGDRRVLRWSDGHTGSSFLNTDTSTRHINLGPLTEKEWLVVRLKLGI